MKNNNLNKNEILKMANYKSRKGKNNPMWKKHHRPESIERISEGMRNYHNGIHVTRNAMKQVIIDKLDEHIQKMGYDENCNCIRLVLNNGSQEFFTKQDVADVFADELSKEIQNEDFGISLLQTGKITPIIDLNCYE